MSDTLATPETPVDTPTPEPDVFSRDYVESLRNENANARVKNKEAVEAAKTETRADVVKEYEPQIAERDTKITELTQSNVDKDREITKLRAVIEAKVPVEDIDTVYDLVQGDDQESISESVKRVMSIYGKKNTPDLPVDPSQGHGSGTPPLNGNQLVDMLSRAVGAKRQ